MGAVPVILRRPKEPEQMQPTRHPDRFVDRHIGPDSRDVEEMLAALGVRNLDELIDRTVPASIRMQKPLDLPAGRSEFGLLRELSEIAAKNQVFRSYIGMGYSDTVTPPVIQRNILENPGWYTQYTPYQPEISQGRLEALLNYQTMVEDLTALPVANASLLDEATAAAEAMTMFHNVAAKAGNAFFVAQNCHPQTIEVVRMRAAPFGIEVIVGDPASFDPARQKVFGALLQYPATDGAVRDPRKFIERAHAQGALVVVAADIIALTLLTPPGELGADCAVGSTQRFGVPLGYGGPHAAYFATKNEYVRHMPGRIIGVSVDAQGHTALRMALQTREQHIRREKATSNICTAQALLAIISGMYAVYHGPNGVALDETTTPEDVRDVLAAFAGARPVSEPTADDTRLPRSLLRKSGYLGHPVFNTHHSETEMLRYMRLLESRDLSLTRSMIPLGSCTMKLNATAEM
ncbi:MAG: glycine dehydrogenase (aminomethyl-transferring), partial [Deltaproteobacteria bacterium]